MATIKSYTDIEQSRKLAEILPLESADMRYQARYDSNNNLRYIPKFTLTIIPLRVDIPCWSLAALLGVLPKNFNYNFHTYQFMYNTHGMFYMNLDTYDEDTFYSTNENLVDACYEMILTLNELNLL